MAEVQIYHGDSAEVLQAFAAESIDAVVTDGPYALVSIGKRFGAEDAAPVQSNGPSGVYGRAAAGFMGQRWDTGETAFSAVFWREVWRVLKPGAWVAAFGGTRTHHRLAVAIEDAGFDIRDDILDMVSGDGAVRAFVASLSEEQLRAFGRVLEDSQFGGLLAWAFATGFPKSDNVERAVARFMCPLEGRHYENSLPTETERELGDHICPRCAEGDGFADFGTALKPAFEPIVLARKPMIGPIARNVLAHGTGGLNIGACRVASGRDERSFRLKRWRPGAENVADGAGWRAPDGGDVVVETPAPRWPANVIHDGSDAVRAAFPAAPGQKREVTGEERAHSTKHAYNSFGESRAGMTPRGDQGSAARFFYSAKADAEDRLGTTHPTVKPVALMAWLVRLVCPPGGVVLDPFAGSGTTGLAAMGEGCDAILIEREAEYVADIRRRIAWARGEGRRLDEEVRAHDLAADPAKAMGADMPLLKRAV